jgi:translation elongation factor EF-1alpha
MSPRRSKSDKVQLSCPISPTCVRTEHDPHLTPSQSVALVRLRPLKPVVVEEHAQFPLLGRVILLAGSLVVRCSVRT